MDESHTQPLNSFKYNIFCTFMLQLEIDSI